MGITDSVPVDEKMASEALVSDDEPGGLFERRWFLYLIVFLVVSAIYLGCVVSPPSLQDDVDAVQAVIARNMLSSGDWVTARLDGVIYLEKPPLIYWFMALSYRIFGVSDWAARLPVAIATIALALLTAAFGMWAFGKRAGFYAGLVMATCVGLFLFTRIQIPDVMLTFTIMLAMWAFLRALDQEEQIRASGRRFWRQVWDRLLLKSLIGIVFPVAAALLYLFVTEQFFSAEPGGDCTRSPGRRSSWRSPFRGTYLATISNPPYFEWTLKSGPGLYHGFLWFLFHQRTAAAVPEPSLSARLQHRPATVLLAVSSAVAISLERLSSAVFKLSYKPRIAPAAPVCWRSAGPASCWCSLPFPRRRNIIRCPATRLWRFCWVPPWPRAEVDSRRHARAHRHRGLAAVACLCRSDWSVRHPHPGRYLAALSHNPQATALARPHAGPDRQFIRLSSFATLYCRRGVPDRYDRRIYARLGFARF